MKKKKVVFILLGILLVIVLALAYHYRDRRTYELNLPQIEEILRIELKRNAEGVIFFGIEEMEAFLKRYSI